MSSENAMSRGIHEVIPVARGAGNIISTASLPVAEAVPPRLVPVDIISITDSKDVAIAKVQQEVVSTAASEPLSVAEANLPRHVPVDIILSNTSFTAIASDVVKLGLEKNLGNLLLAKGRDVVFDSDKKVSDRFKIVMVTSDDELDALKAALKSLLPKEWPVEEGKLIKRKVVDSSGREVFANKKLSIQLNSTQLEQFVDNLYSQNTDDQVYTGFKDLYSVEGMVRRALARDIGQRVNYSERHLDHLRWFMKEVFLGDNIAINTPLYDDNSKICTISIDTQEDQMPKLISFITKYLPECEVKQEKGGWRGRNHSSLDHLVVLKLTEAQLCILCTHRFSDFAAL